MSDDSAVFATTTNVTGVSSNTIQNMKTDWADSRSVKQAGYWEVFEHLGTISPHVRDAMVEASRAMLSGQYLPQIEGDSDEEYDMEDYDDDEADNTPVFNTTSNYPLSNAPHYIEKRTSKKFSRFLGLEPLVPQTGDQEVQVQKGWAGQKQSKPKGNQKSGRADAIRAKNSKKRADEEDEVITEIMQDLNTLINEIPSGINRNCGSVQLVLTRLMGHINAITNNHSTLSEEKKIDLYFGVDKIVHAISELEVRNHIDNSIAPLGEDQSVIDLRVVYDRFRTAVFPDPTVPVLRAADVYARFFQFTSYDDFLPSTKIQLFDSQLRMLGLLANQLRSSSLDAASGLLTVLNTVPGQGKTTLVLAIAKMLLASSHNRVIYYPGVGRKGRSRGDAKRKVRGRTLKMLYVTPKSLLPVAKQVGSLLFESTPFGIGYTETSSTGQKTFNVCENFNCYSGKKRVLYTPPVAVLCSPTTAVEILKHNKEQRELHARGQNCDSLEANTKYVVFYDEPTATGMDQPGEDNIQVTEFAEFIKVMPKWTILSCATLRNIQHYPTLCDIFTSKYPGALLETVNNSKIPIGASVMNFGGNVMLPHNKCTTVAQLASVITKLEDEIILQKFYTHRIVHSMYQHLMTLGVQIPTNLQYGAYISTHEICQDSIQRLAIEYLRLVLTASTDDDTLIVRFCSQVINLMNFNAENILSNVSKLKSQTLVVGQDPVQLFKTATTTHYKRILEHFKADCFRGIESDYRHKISSWNTAYEAKLVEESKRKADGGKKKGRDGSDGEGGKKTSNKFDVSTFGTVDMRMETWKNSHPCPSLNLPSSLGIRSMTQTKEKARGMVDYCSAGYDLINPGSGDDLADDMLKVMLAAGVGVYSNQLNESYLRVVTEQMEKGNMSIVFVNDDICYGVNYPIENIVILDTPLMMNRSVNTLLQLISRAGRKGKSDKANIWIAEPVLNKLQDYIMDPDFEDVELNNIRYACSLSIE